MTALDDWLTHLVEHAPLPAVLGIAILLGLRHACDPDHLVAVSSLIAGGDAQRVRRATLLGLLWGAGHAVTLVAVGLPIVLLRMALPGALDEAAELAIGLLIVGLALRLLRRWRAGISHGHDHRAPATRSPALACAIGALHGLGGSAAVTVLLLGLVHDRTVAAVCLALFAACTAVSMALLSTAFGCAIARAPRFAPGRVAPILGTVGFLFGTYYALGAVGLL